MGLACKEAAEGKAHLSFTFHLDHTNCRYEVFDALPTKGRKSSMGNTPETYLLYPSVNLGRLLVIFLWPNQAGPDTVLRAAVSRATA